NRIQACRFGLVPQRVVGVGAVDYFGQEHESGITGEAVLFHNGVERALPAVMAEFDVGHVIRNRSFPLGYGHDLLGRYKEELRLWVHELFDKPRAGYTVYLDALPRYPLHWHHSSRGMSRRLFLGGG